MMNKLRQMLKNKTENEQCNFIELRKKIKLLIMKTKRKQKKIQLISSNLLNFLPTICDDHIAVNLSFLFFFFLCHKLMSSRIMNI